MRFIPFLCLVLIFTFSAAQAQSVSENLPTEMGQDEEIAPPSTVPAVSAQTYTVTDVNADVTADNAAHARDQALMQAERDAFTQLCSRLGAPEGTAKLNDDAIAALVQSFEVQSERLSTVRYIGVFTIRFKPTSVQKKIGKAAPTMDINGNVIAPSDKSMPQGPQSRIMVAVATDSLATWTQIKRRLTAVPQISRVDTMDLGRGVSHINLSYGGSMNDLQQAVTTQGFVLRQSAAGTWDLIDGSMIAR